MSTPHDIDQIQQSGYSNWMSDYLILIGRGWFQIIEEHNLALISPYTHT